MSLLLLYISPADWQAFHSSILVSGFPAVSLGLRQPGRGEESRGKEPTDRHSICKCQNQKDGPCLVLQSFDFTQHFKSTIKSLEQSLPIHKK